MRIKKRKRIKIEKWKKIKTKYWLLLFQYRRYNISSQTIAIII